jgi:uncharacterized membrane protein
VTHPRLPVDITYTLAAVPFAIGAAIIVVGAVLALFSGRHAGLAFANHLTLGLEFLLAAGLLRLASADQLEMLGLVAAVIVTRRIIVVGLRYSTRAIDA